MFMVFCEFIQSLFPENVTMDEWDGKVVIEFGTIETNLEIGDEIFSLSSF